MKDRLGGLHSARLLLASVDFAEVEHLQVTGQWEEAGRILAGIAKRLEIAGAELLLLCTNTMHKVADQIQAAVSIPLIHLADTTAAAIINAGLDTVGLLGTAFTMEQDFYRDRVARHGLRILVPGEVDRAAVHKIIYDELCLGIISERSRASYRAAINHLVEAGAEGIILGCTEIELLVADSDSPVPLFPTTRLHVEAAVAVSLEGLEIAPTLAGGRMRVLSTKDRSAADVLRAVQSNPIVLGIVPADAVNARVRVLTVGGRHPLREPQRYPLHTPSTRPLPEITTITAVGDIMLGRRVGDRHRADPGALLKPLAKRLASAEITIGNFESTLSTAGSPTQGGDSFAASPRVVPGLRAAGFDLLSLANNHVGDYGDRALRQTLSRFSTSTIDIVGAGRNLAQARGPVIVERDGRTRL